MKSSKLFFFFSLCFTLAISICIFTPLKAQETSKINNPELRGVWIATAYGIDWPKTKDPQKQQKSLRKLFKDIASKNCNAVFFQVRIRGDVLFFSNHEPFSNVLTGKLGEVPSYDPVNFAISLAHEYGLEFHAWFNTMILRGKKLTPISVGTPHIWQTHPEWIDRRAVKNPNQKVAYLNPGLPEVRAHLINLITDFARRYDVDGIQCDDYLRYPSQFFPDEPEYNGFNPNHLPRAEWRRENLNLFVKSLYDSLMQIKPYLKFGISPIGVYKRVDSEPAMESYTDVYQDSRAWSMRKSCDYLAPQVYFHIGPTYYRDRILGKFNPDFKALLLDWASNKNERHLYVGLGPYKPAVKSELQTQISLVQESGAEGMIFYPYHAIADIPKLFEHKVSTPPMPWKTLSIPSAPNNIELIVLNNEPYAYWPKSPSVRWTNIYRVNSEGSELIHEKVWGHNVRLNATTGDTLYFTTINRFGQESPASLPMTVP